MAALESEFAVAERLDTVLGEGVVELPATEMVDVPLSPLLEAVIVADPAPTAVTRPVLLTVATAGVLLVHATGWPVITLPLASWTTAVNCDDCPAVRLTHVGVTDTDAAPTGAVGVPGKPAGVVAPATLESAPNTTLPALSAPRKATTWN